MQSHTLPRTQLRISRLAYGIGMLGTSWSGTGFLEKSVRAIRTAYDCGVTLFDTADVYAAGQSDVALGRVLKESPAFRDDVVIQSKCGLRLHERWEPSVPVGPDSLIVDLSRSRILNSVDATLRRLGTDRLDILLLHAPSALGEPQEIAAAFEQLSRSGKVLHFGVCGHTAAQIELLRRDIRQPLIVQQLWLSLAHYAPIVDDSGFGSMVDYCRLHDIQVQAFSPLKGGGIFERPLLLGPPADAQAEVHRLSAKLRELAAQHSVTPAAIMLAWLLRHPARIVPIIGASTREHIQEACAADEVELDPAEWQILRALAAPIQ